MLNSASHINHEGVCQQQTPGFIFVFLNQSQMAIQRVLNPVHGTVFVWRPDKSLF